MKHKTVLFTPIEVGIAHIARSLSIAEALHTLGHTVLFALPKRKHELFKNSPVTFVDISPCLTTDSIGVVSVWRDEDKIAQLVKDELHLVETYKPDVLVGDFRLSTMVVGYIKDLPTFWITGGGGLPEGCKLPNPKLPNTIHSMIAPLLEKAVWSVKRPFLTRLETVALQYKNDASIDEILKRITYIIPEYDGYLQPVNSSYTIHYTGPLAWDGFAHMNRPRWLSNLQKTGKTVYLSFGGTGFDAQKMIDVSTLLIEIGYTVVVSTSTLADPKDFPKHNNLHVERYVPGNEVCKNVDLVVCHGGYGTMVQAIQAGVPVVAIPFNPDQIIHSLRFQELGLAKTLFNFDLPFLVNLVKGDWDGFEEAGKRIPPENIIQAVVDVLQNGLAYKKSVAHMAKKLAVPDMSRVLRVIERV